MWSPRQQTTLIHICVSPGQAWTSSSADSVNNSRLLYGKSTETLQSFHYFRWDFGTKSDTIRSSEFIPRDLIDLAHVRSVTLLWVFSQEYSYFSVSYHLIISLSFHSIFFFFFNCFHICNPFGLFVFAGEDTTITLQCVPKQTRWSCSSEESDLIPNQSNCSNWTKHAV